MLTKTQIDFYCTFGFLKFNQYFSENELEIINTEFEAGMILAGLNDRPDNHLMLLKWSDMGPESPFLRSLQEDPRFLGVAEQIYGEDVVGVFCNANRYSGNSTEWHPDVENIHFHGIKFLIYLQPVDGESGALRVIPGSHKNPLHDKLLEIKLRGPDSPYLNASGYEINDIPAHICNSEPGDVIAFDFRLWHAAWSGTTDRRMCSLNYYKNPKKAEEIAAAKELAVINKKNQAPFKNPQFHPYWLENVEGSAKRQQWIEWLENYAFIEPVKS